MIVAEGGYISSEAALSSIYFSGGSSTIINFTLDSCALAEGSIGGSTIDQTCTSQARTIVTNSTNTAYTVSSLIIGKYNRYSSSNTINVYISTQSTGIYNIDTGSVITFLQNGNGKINITKSPSVTLNSYNNGTQTYGLYSSIQLINVSHNVWDLIGAV